MAVASCSFWKICIKELFKTKYAYQKLLFWNVAIQEQLAYIRIRRAWFHF
jgi:hypothetical protein